MSYKKEFLQSMENLKKEETYNTVIKKTIIALSKK